MLVRLEIYCIRDLFRSKPYSYSVQQTKLLHVGKDTCNINSQICHRLFTKYYSSSVSVILIAFRCTVLLIAFRFVLL